MKKILFSLLALIISASIYAHDIEVKNIDGVTIYYNYNYFGTGLEVTYRGSYESSYLNEYQGKIVIPAEVTYENRTHKVTSIGYSAFNGCSGLTSITIPYTVHSIENTAFIGCSGLTSIMVENGNPIYDSPDNCNAIIEKDRNILIVGCQNTKIPNSVTRIGSSAFSGCTGLTSITIPNSVTNIGSSAFSGCSGLTSITVEEGNSMYDSRDNCNAIIEKDRNRLIVGCQNTKIPNNVMSIGDGAFSGCTSLTSITIPNNVTSIRDGAFSGCTGLTSITVEEGNSMYDSRDNCNAIIAKGSNSLIVGCKNTIIPNSVTSIGLESFRDCTSLTSITIPNSVTSIGWYAFFGCSGLISISIPNSVTNIGSRAFDGCTSLTSITIPNSVTSIEEYTFHACTSLTSITIPDSITSIGIAAFWECAGLTSVTIPNSVKSIGNSAFSGCAGLTSITIPNSVTSIGERAFSGCSLLENVNALPSTPPFLYDNSFSNYSITLNVPKGCKEAYQSALGWRNFKNIIAPGGIYKLVYMVDGEEYASYSIEEGSHITPEPVPTKEGYTFSGWSEIPETMPAQDVIITGTFTLTYPNGQCETPTISYANGRLKYECKTVGAEFVTTITDDDIKTHIGDEVTLTATYTINVIAKADGYEDSEVATATLCWIDAEPWAEGTKEAEDNVTEVKAIPILIQTEGNIISVQGAAEGTEISVYSLDGVKQGSVVAKNGITTISTNLQYGSTAIVRIGNKSVKVMIK